MKKVFILSSCFIAGCSLSAKSTNESNKFNPSIVSIAKAGLETGKNAGIGFAIHAGLHSALLWLDSNNTADYKEYYKFWIESVKNTDVLNRLLLLIPIYWTAKGLYKGYNNMPETKYSKAIEKIGSIDNIVVELSQLSDLDEINHVLDEIWCKSSYPRVQGHIFLVDVTSSIDRSIASLKIAKNCNWVNPEMNQEAAAEIEKLSELRSKLADVLKIIKSDELWQESFKGFTEDLRAHYAKVAADEERRTRMIAEWTNLLTAITPSTTVNVYK